MQAKAFVATAKTDEGVPPARTAAQNRRAGVLQMLAPVGQGGCAQARTGDGVTAALIVAQNGDVDAMQVLAQAKADVD